MRRPKPEARGLKPVVHVHVYVYDHDRYDDSFTASKGVGKENEGRSFIKRPLIPDSR